MAKKTPKTTSQSTPEDTPETPEKAAAEEPRSDVEAPDDLAAGGIQLTWSSADYGSAISGSGAAKLMESEVAPLVAVAAAFKTIVPDTVKAACLEYGLGDARSTAAKMLVSSVGDRDAMMMPWFSFDDVMETNHRRRNLSNVEPEPSTTQWRPAKPQIGKSGKTLKYVIAGGQQTSIGLHPATPLSWSQAPTVVIAEGLIKALAALTGVLRTAGVSVKDLSYNDPSDAREKLRTIMEGVPVKDRVLIPTILGVGTWHNHNEWNAIDMTKKDVIIGFDGDTASNPQVWSQAKQMWESIERKKGYPSLLVLPDIPGQEKPGIDDYLAFGGDWPELLEHVVDELPPRPRDPNEGRVEEWRVNETELTTEKLDSVPDDFGGTIKKWVTAVRMAGRVTHMKTIRSASAAELETGVYDAKEDARAKGTVEVEVTWLNPSGGESRALVNGPSDILAEQPGRWHKVKQDLPAALTKHKDWPPDPAWLKAIKAHREEETVETSVWDHMGWVPVPGGLPVFIAGKSVLGLTGLTDAATPGITDVELAGASKFGLNPLVDEQGRMDKAAVRKALLKLYEVFVKNGVWQHSGVAAVVLSAGLRPCVPLYPRTSILLTGARRAGKSYTAEQIMTFWQARKGAFDALPGSAEDTKYSIENAVARTPIWVADDVAPSVDQRKSQATEAKIGSIIRDVFNGTATRRMASDGTARELLTPRAIFMATAENTQSASSEMDRVVHVNAGENFLSVSTEPTEAMSELGKETVIANQVVAAAIQLVLENAASDTWAQVVEDWKDKREELRANAIHHMGSSSNAARHATMAADLGLGLALLTELAVDVDAGDEVVASLDELMGQLYDYVNLSYQDQTSTGPGARIVQALRAVLGSGKGHVAVSGSGAPPIPDGDARYGKTARSLNQRLGWQMGAGATDDPRPLGPVLGHILFDTDGGAHVMFDMNNAFAEGQRHHPNLILHGSRATSTWESAWNEKLCSTAWKRKKRAGGALRPVARAKFQGQDMEGVPVPLETLLNMDGPED